MDKFDEIDIGNYILSKFQLNEDREEEIGRIILSYFLDKHEGYKILKRDLSKYINTLLFLFNEETIISSKLVKFSNDAYIKYRVFKLNEPLDGRYEILINDFSEICNKFIIIDELEAFSKGAGRKLMKEFLKNVTGIPVILKAGITSKGLYENGNIKEHLTKLERYYNKLGFVSINNIIGCYTESISMINTNGGNIDGKFLKTISENRCR